jgi:hypothetical protein
MIGIPTALLKNPRNPEAEYFFVAWYYFSGFWQFWFSGNSVLSSQNWGIFNMNWKPGKRLAQSSPHFSLISLPTSSNSGTTYGQTFFVEFPCVSPNQ